MNDKLYMRIIVTVLNPLYIIWVIFLSIPLAGKYNLIENVDPGKAEFAIMYWVAGTVCLTLGSWLSKRMLRNEQDIKRET